MLRDLSAAAHYVEDGDELWSLLSDAVVRRVYLRPGFVYDLPAGAGTRDITASKTVIGDTVDVGSSQATIRLAADDYLQLDAKCEFENVKFTDNWSTPPVNMIKGDDAGCSSSFKRCTFAPANEPASSALSFNVTEGNYVSFEFEDCVFEAGGASWGADGLQAWTKVRDCVVRGCRFIGFDKALLLTGGNEGTVLVEGNSFVDLVGSGLRLQDSVQSSKGSTIIRGNYFYRSDDAAPLGLLEVVGTGKKIISDNYFRTVHTDETAWNVGFLIKLDGGDIQLLNNEIRGGYMDQTVSGLVAITKDVDSCLVQGNHFRGGPVITKLLVLESEGISGMPRNVQIVNNKFSELVVADATYIKIQDQSAGSNPRASLGTISNNTFTGPNGVAIRAVDCDAGAGDEAVGFSITGNVMDENVRLYQTAFRTSIFHNNINLGGEYATSPGTALGDNLVGDNLKVVPPS
jgi:hypothetical protein